MLILIEILYLFIHSKMNNDTDYNISNLTIKQQAVTTHQLKTQGYSRACDHRSGQEHTSTSKLKVLL